MSDVDNQPRYTTKRLHDEIDRAQSLARLQALEEAAAIVDDSAGEYEKAAGGADGIAHDAMLMAGDALELVRDAIRERIAAVPAFAPLEQNFPKYRNLVNGDLCELVSQGVYGVTFRRVGGTQLAYLGHSEFCKRFELMPPAPQDILLGWQSMETAPKDGTMLHLLVRPGQEELDPFTSFHDSREPYETIGFNQLSDTTIDEWQFAGWDWCHDCITDGHGEVIGWRAFGVATTEGSDDGC